MMYLFTLIYDVLVYSQIIHSTNPNPNPNPGPGPNPNPIPNQVALAFLSPGRHAGAGGDIEEILAA